MINGERNIEFLIDSYYGKDANRNPDFGVTKWHHERWGNDYRNQILREARERRKLVLCGILADHRLSAQQKDECKHIIQNLDVSNFPKVSDEQFVTMIVLYVRIRKKPYRLHDYRYMLERVDLTLANFTNFVIHLSEMYAENSYVTIPEADAGYYERKQAKDDVGYGDYSCDGSFGGGY